MQFAIFFTLAGSLNSTIWFSPVLGRKMPSVFDLPIWSASGSCCRGLAVVLETTGGCCAGWRFIITSGKYLSTNTSHTHVVSRFDHDLIILAVIVSAVAIGAD